MTVVVVHHGTPELVLPALRSIRAAARRTSIEMLVLDAGSSGAAGARDAALAAGAEFVPLDANRGFGAAANAGAARARGALLLFANPDTRASEGALDALAERIRADETVAAVAPRLLDEHGDRQRGDAGEHPTMSAALRYALLRGGIFDADETSQDRRVGWLSGAWLLVRADAFRSVGGFDESFFLYGEDVDLGRRLAARGFSSVYVPAVVVVHEGGRSHRLGTAISRLEGAWAEGLARAHARSGASALARAAFAALLALGILGRAVALALGAGRPRDPRARRLKARRLLAAARRALLH